MKMNVKMNLSTGRLKSKLERHVEQMLEELKEGHYTRQEFQARAKNINTHLSLYRSCMLINSYDKYLHRLKDICQVRYPNGGGE